MKPGYAFGEHVNTSKSKRRKYTYGDEPVRPRPWRGFLFPIALVAIIGLFTFKLVSLQLVQGAEYRNLADSNRIRNQLIHAPRGIIFDRNGKPLVYNTPGFRRLEFDKKTGAVTKTEILNKEEALQLIAQGTQNISVDSLRQYPYRDVMSHVLGYIGPISEEEIGEPTYSSYLPTDWIGKSGIEKTYELTLRGQSGQQLIEVNAMGEKVRALGQTDPVPGQNVTLTLDIDLQQTAYDAMKDVPKGALIISKPNGEILSMVSKPSYDDNLFTQDKSYKVASGSAYTKLQDVLLDGKNQPLLNRAIGGIYPPASTFKIITALTGLQNKIIDKNYRVVDTGVLKVGEFSYANWYFTDNGKKEAGALDVTRALARSNDIFFYKLAEKVTMEKLSAMSKKFGLGAPLGIDLAGESEGLVPTKEWKEKTIGEKWFLGDTFHYGIGQGYLLATPLQVNAWTQILANGGTLYQPHLNKLQDERILNKNLLSKQAIEPVRQGMVDACTEGKGVAWPLYDLRVENRELRIDGKNFLKVASAAADMRQITVACKTGTAQHGGEDTKPHAWITLFAPAYKPQVVITVLVESSGEGSNFAAPIAKTVLEKYFSELNR